MVPLTKVLYAREIKGVSLTGDYEIPGEGGREAF